MSKLSWISGAALAACMMLAGCFTSEQPLFEQRSGEALMGGGLIDVTTRDGNNEPDKGQLRWDHGAYVDPKGDEHTTISFHRLPGTWPWDNWYVGQTSDTDESHKGYMYELYRRQGAKIYNYNMSCSDLTDAEAAAAHMVRTEGNQECKTTRQSDLAQALRILSAREKPDGYWTWKRKGP